jgi:hypothetical protein
LVPAGGVERSAVRGSAGASAEGGAWDAAWGAAKGYSSGSEGLSNRTPADPAAACGISEPPESVPRMSAARCTGAGVSELSTSGATGQSTDAEAEGGRDEVPFMVTVG